MALTQAEYEDRVARLKEVNKVISGLEPEIRASSFELLSEYVEAASGGGKASSGGKAEKTKKKAAPAADVPLPAYLAARKLPGNKEKAAAIVIWSGLNEEVDKLAVSDVERLWKKTPHKLPKNVSRDLGEAHKQGWINQEGTGRNMRYSSNGYSEKWAEEVLTEDKG